MPVKLITVQLAEQRRKTREDSRPRMIVKGGDEICICWVKVLTKMSLRKKGLDLDLRN